MFRSTGLIRSSVRAFGSNQPPRAPSVQGVTEFLESLSPAARKDAENIVNAYEELLEQRAFRPRFQRFDNQQRGEHNANGNPSNARHTENGEVRERRVFSNEHKLFIKNLSFATTWQTLKARFEEVGAVAFATILKSEDGKPRGMALVTMEKPEDAKRALQELNGAELDGRQLRVEAAREFSRREESPKDE
ncbi:mitochondrial glycine-rich RNA-binding protein [Andalucia godoyi]|uniref:Mitochondrial glycine-rich RNA-binding protein n=1 Tax=Andalucia godoyi TaxID=505711 RepID=A0A8K0F2K1_ANDGO|nr:mitochondrial glycine-rich RNA-binding protein [Andalucia godoyi]|eukprot:ANDGO_05396.mRNA.1 mitochondrial glycine-rich RNA-binding protein